MRPGCTRQSRGAPARGRATASVPTTARAAPAASTAATAASSRSPPPTWTGMATAAQMAATSVALHGRARPRAVEVDDVEPARAVGRPARAPPRPGRRRRRSRDRTSPCVQADAAPAAQVDRRVDDHPRPAAPRTLAHEALEKAEADAPGSSRGGTGTRRRCRAPTLEANSAAVGGRRGDERRVRAAPGSRSARSRRRRRRRTPASAGARWRMRSGFQPMCGTFRSALAGKRTTRPGRTPRPAHRPELLALLEEELHAEADAEERPPGVDRRAAPARSSPSRAGWSCRRAKAPTPGSTTAGAARDALGVARHLGRLPDALERLLHAPQVAHAVVDDRERAHGRLPDYSVPLVESTPWTRGSRCVARSRRGRAP